MDIERRSKSAGTSNLRRVLCVDDAVTALALRARILKMNGYQVTAYSSPVQAAQMFDGREFDMAVLDYEMPAMNGSQLAEHLKTTHPELKIILYTGSGCEGKKDLRFIDVIVDKSEGVFALLAAMKMFLPQSWPNSQRPSAPLA